MKPRWMFAALPVLALSAGAPPVVASALIALSSAASAEPVRLAQMQYGVLPPYEIETIVRSAGLDPIDRPLRRGPRYVLHAIGRDDREVRVVVSLSGEILRVVPVMNASRAPGRGVTMGPYERMDGYVPERRAPRYVAPGDPRYGTLPPEDDEDDDEQIDASVAPRPPGSVPNGAPRGGYSDPPPVIRATPGPRGQDYSRGADLPPPSGSSRSLAAAPPPASEPRAITGETSRDGLLPPPPERFPQRAAPAAPARTPAAKPPVKRAASAAAPKIAPLPKPKPAIPASAPAQASPTAQPAPAKTETPKDASKAEAANKTEAPKADAQKPEAPAKTDAPQPTPPSAAAKPAPDASAVPH